MGSISLHNCSWMWRSTKSVWPVITKCNLYLGSYLTSVRQSNSSRSQLWYQWLAFRLSCNRRKWNHKDLCLSCRYVVTKDIDILLDYLFYQSSAWLVLFMFTVIFILAVQLKSYLIFKHALRIIPYAFH